MHPLIIAANSFFDVTANGISDVIVSSFTKLAAIFSLVLRAAFSLQLINHAINDLANYCVEIVKLRRSSSVRQNDLLQLLVDSEGKML